MKCRLFYGSADAIKMAGPSVLLAYIIGGIAAYIIMRALGDIRAFASDNATVVIGTSLDPDMNDELRVLANSKFLRFIE